jgi:phosphoserine phosphatase
MLTDVPCRAVSALMAEVWLTQRERVFDFVRPMVAALRKAGYTPMLITGGPEELVAHLAAELQIDRFRGTRFLAEDDLYTGKLESTVVGVKDQVALALAGGEPIAWSSSLTIGNSLGDLPLFKRVGQPLAFEPSPALLALARESSWPVADRHDLPSVLRHRFAIPCAADHGSGIPSTPAMPAHTPRVRDAAEKLVDRVLAEVSPAGVVRGGNESRVTETALMLTLLRRENLLPATQRALRAYLVDSASSADRFDTAVINATLVGTPVPDRERLIDQTFEGAAQHSSARKRLALAAILAVVSSEPFHVDAPSDAFSHRGEATWTHLRMVSIHHLNTPEPVAPELTARLMQLIERGQRCGGVIEKQTFSHLFALLALNRVRPGHPLTRAGVPVLAAAQNPDGGMPLAVSLEIFATATAGLALTRAGVSRRTLITMADYLASQQAANGGWSNAEDVLQTDADTTTHVLAFLHPLDQDRYRAQIERARRFLCDLIGPDGGVPTYSAGKPGEVTMAANALLALAPYGRAHQRSLERVAGFVLRAQRMDGTFERSWSLCEANAMFRARLALRAVKQHNPASHQGRIDFAIDAAQRRLLTTAHTDGGWGQIPSEPSDPISTSYSLIALAEDHRHSAVVREGTRYLLSQQNPDGGYTSIADQAGPRPLRYGVPALVNNFVLLAMTYMDPSYRYADSGHGKRHSGGE